MHSLNNEKITLNVCIGAAGTGKTTLAVAYALKEWDTKKKKIYFSKAAVMVGKGRAFGPVPGDINQKYGPYLDSFKIVIKKVLGAKTDSYIDAMIECKNFNYQPIEFVRGNTYENCTFILDEVQNLTWHELKTLLSRMGENSKVILIGDPFQRDVSFKHTPNGMDTLLNSELFQSSSFTSFVELKKQYRSPLADLIYKIDLDEIKKHNS
jgi:PhoH-like ATPase